MKCRKCGAEMMEGALFCMMCGAKKGRTCTKCGVELPDVARFCFKCGNEVKSTEGKKPLQKKLWIVSHKLRKWLTNRQVLLYGTAHRMALAIVQ